ncbi:uncharacterized protein BDR25DRAFT_277053 [Lindgomyces ingoldianus]|uniref:Uncharacterized protein n=1 Tax=Lindgomyces ingoldianus TaxID=673940 RepID=A0ACB6RDV1_9PLEO|nr:uncharacterized protein BDR25DRAFT_277053 [Lindgomyces ingoldianus]KAF2477287.1 hypothetical protein BDR25DRAFT_277053 [Lindgomyces ingoldianus]
MAGDDIDNDDYVANLLKQDAKNTAKKYDMVGLDAFIPKRSQLRAPKPNTRFLRHIIRETDSHNAALLAKEAEESRARLRELNKEKMRKEKDERRREQGRLTPPDMTDDERRHTKRKRPDYSDDEEQDRVRRRKREYADLEDYRSRKSRETERDRQKEKARYEHGKTESSKHRSRRERRHRHRERGHDSGSEEDDDRSCRKDNSHPKHRRRKYCSESRSRSKSRSPSTSPYPQRHKSSRQRHESHSRRRQSENPCASRYKHKISDDKTKQRRQSAGPGSDSDPLEAIVGPLPPPQPIVRSRGRGAYKANSMAMDARFSSGYDPSTDIHLNSDVEDDWDDALEALRDRQKWRQQGAERLKEAGFSADQVKKWEKGDVKNEEDVVWTKKGEGREWDRGKVVDDDGDVDLRAEWARLR